MNIALRPALLFILATSLLVAALAAGLLVGRPVAEANTATRVPEDVRARFDYLSQNGNSNCSRQIIEAIPTMPVMARLQGSCCSPMNLHRYSEQLEGLQAYRSIESIPADPYDIEAGLAAKLLAYYELELSPREQAAYDYAMDNSAEGGPCCCECWRWAVYGGLAKYLIRDRQFTGDQIARIWDLSDGCGGDSHVH
jgi:hypothetical protein